MATHRVPAGELRALAQGVLAAAGMSAEDAATTAEPFIWAHLRGVDSHGVAYVARYVELFATGEANPTPDIRIERLRAAALLVDADRAPGPLALTRAMREAIAVACETGVAWATVRGTALTGAIGYYTSLAADEGLAGIGMVAGVPNMVYAGAHGVGVATSPLSIAVPAAEYAPFVLDMATAGIALGKFAQYRTDGRELPAGVAVTADGEPTTDPNVAKIPLPAAGAKGSGMSLAFELLSSGLAGNPIVAEYHRGVTRHRQNATLIAVDVAAFLPPAEFAAGTDATLAAIKGLPSDVPVLYPGERGAATYAERLEHGIPLAPEVWNELSELANALGVEV